MVVLATLNVKKLGNPYKFFEILSLLKSNSVNIIIITELHLTAAKATEYKNCFFSVKICINVLRTNIDKINIIFLNLKKNKTNNVFFTDSESRALNMSYILDG